MVGDGRATGRWGAVAAAVPLLLAAVGCSGGGSATPAHGGRNVLLVVVDTLRADRLGCYGFPRPTSPAIDGLAARGLRFTQYRSVAPTTLASFTSILTGRHPHTHGVFRNGVVWPDGLTGIPTRFADAGFETAGFVASYCLTSPFGVSRGFERFDEHLDVALPDLPQNTLIRLGADVTRAVVGWLDERDPERPFFAMVHYFDPHWPYSPPPGYAERFDPGYTGSVTGSFEDRERLRQRLAQHDGRPDADTEHLHALHLGEIRYVDDQIAALLAALDAHGLASSTLVVLTADHGESIYEHGDYFDHGLTVYDTNVRVPLIFAGPGVGAAGRTVAAPYSSIDLGPTLLAWANLDTPPEFEGRSFLPVLADPAAAAADAERDQFAEATQPADVEPASGWKNRTKARCVVRGGLKAVVWPFRGGRRELYDLRADPGETRDLSGSRASTPDAARMYDDLARWSEIEPAVMPPGPAEDPEVLERLRSLGYVQ